MKAALVIPGGPKYPDPDKAAQFGTLYYDERFVTRQFFDELRARPAPRPWPGFQIDPSWNGLNAAALATTAHSRLVDFGCPRAEPCPVLFDIEYHDPQYVLDWLRVWRAIRPTRATVWTLEPLQGGWFTPELVAAVNADPNLRVCVQLYRGNMSPVAERACVNDLARPEVGVDPKRVCSFYSPVFPEAGDGVVFNFDELP